MLKCKKDRTNVILTHLNNIEPEYIKFAKQKEEEGKHALLYLELVNNRKNRQRVFGVHYKKTHTNITMKKNQNHKQNAKKRKIKGYA